ncbi:hypothetical protein AGMMS50249_3020 [candidate division SR1 bacterium]|nr:hypothetical protein AGMMS50249_3020 [candidate division SR1 bacterium]
MKKAFTLVEMVIVIVIVGIIALFSISSISSQIYKLQGKITRESFLSAYQNIYSHNLTSSLVNNDVYTGLNVEFMSGGNGFSVKYDGEKSANLAKQDFIYFDQNFRIISIHKFSPNQYNGEIINKTDIPQLSVLLKPYSIKCQLPELENIETIVIVSEIRKRNVACFRIQTNLCRLIEIPCPVLD